MNGEINFDIEMNVFVTIVVGLALTALLLYVGGGVIDVIKKSKKNALERKKRK